MVKAARLKKATTFVVDCSKPVDDKIMEIASFEKFLQVRRHHWGLAATGFNRAARGYAAVLLGAEHTMHTADTCGGSAGLETSLLCSWGSPLLDRMHVRAGGNPAGAAGARRQHRTYTEFCSRWFERGMALCRRASSGSAAPRRVLRARRWAAGRRDAQRRKGG